MLCWRHAVSTCAEACQHKAPQHDLTLACQRPLSTVPKAAHCARESEVTNTAMQRVRTHGVLISVLVIAASFLLCPPANMPKHEHDNKKCFRTEELPDP